MSRKVKHLRSLLRLQGWAVDERRRELGILLARENVLLEQDRAMDRQLRVEQEVSRGDPAVSGHNFAAYFMHYLRQKEAMAMLLAGLAAEIATARDRLGDAYREQKVLEDVHQTRLDEQRVDENRREQSFFDEVAQNQFARHQADDVPGEGSASEVPNAPFLA